MHVPFTVFTENPNKFPGVQAVALDARRTNFNQRRNLYLDEVPQSFYALQWGLEYTATLLGVHAVRDTKVLQRLWQEGSPRTNQESAELRESRANDFNTSRTAF